MIFPLLNQMEKLKQKLWNTLQMLTKQDFETFKWFLKQPVLEGVPGIPVNQLEEANMCQTVDLMVQKYQGSGALKVTLEILKKMGRNDLAQELVEYSNCCTTNRGHWGRFFRNLLLWTRLTNVLVLFREPPTQL